MENEASRYVFELLITIGEMLTTTWGGRIVLGMAIGCLITRLVRV